MGAVRFVQITKIVTDETLEGAEGTRDRKDFLSSTIGKKCSSLMKKDRMALAPGI